MIIMVNIMIGQQTKIAKVYNVYMDVLIELNVLLLKWTWIHLNPIFHQDPKCCSDTLPDGNELRPSRQMSRCGCSVFQSNRKPISIMGLWVAGCQFRAMTITAPQLLS